MQLVDAIENSGLAIWVRESPSIFAYTSILALHAMGLAVVVGLNWMVALRVLRGTAGAPFPPLQKLFAWMFAGFWINAASGLVLLAAALSRMLDSTTFFFKLGFVALAMINLRLFKMRVFDRLDASAGDALPASARKFAIASLLLWGCAIAAGRLVSYPGIFG